MDNPDFRHFILPRVFLNENAAESKDGEPRLAELWKTSGRGFVFAIARTRDFNGNIAQDYLRIYGLAKSEPSSLTMVAANANAGPEWSQFKISPEQFEDLLHYYDATERCHSRTLPAKESEAAQAAQAVQKKKAEAVFTQLLASSPLRSSPLKDFLRQSVSTQSGGRKSESDSLTSRQLGLLR